MLFTLINVKYIRLLAIILRSNPSLQLFCTARIGAARTVGGNENAPALPSPESIQKIGEASIAHSAHERTKQSPRKELYWRNA